MKKIIFVLSMFLILLTACSRKPHVVIVTKMGDIEIELDAELTPKHTENFLKLVEEQFFIGTTFHRVIPGSLIQGGDPNSKDSDRNNDGLGGPGYTIEAEIKLPHKRGSVGAARLSDQVNPKRRSSGSQFYICLADMPQLDRGGYTVFGRVIRGMEAADKIAGVKRDARDNPIRRIVIEQVYLN